MQLVDQPYLFPGRCILTGVGGPENGPYIDFGRENNAGERMYMTLQAAKDLCRFIGGATPEDLNALHETTDEVARLQDQLAAKELELGQLQAAVATTLAVGCTFDKKTMRPKLRKAPQADLIPA